MCWLRGTSLTFALYVPGAQGSLPALRALCALQPRAVPLRTEWRYRTVLPQA